MPDNFTFRERKDVEKKIKLKNTIINVDNEV